MTIRLLVISFITGIVLCSLVTLSHAQYVGDKNYGLFDQQKNQILFPLAEKQYTLQIPLHDYRYENSTPNVGYSFRLAEPSKLRTTTDLSIKQSRGFSDSKQIPAGTKIPTIVDFTISFDSPGTYLYTFSESTQGQNSFALTQMGGYVVVSRYSKAVTEDGHCKNPQMLTTPKRDYSTLVCVSLKTHQSLIDRGWAGTESSMREVSHKQKEITILSVFPQNVTLPEPKKQVSKTTCNADGVCFTPE